MTTAPAPTKPRRVSGLAVRLIIVLSLAILPLGSISVFQTWKTLREANALSATALLALTQRAAAKERELIQLAFGAANALGAAVAVLQYHESDCDALMEQLVNSEPNYSFAGFISTDGLAVCTSNGRNTDLRDSSFFKDISGSEGQLIDTHSNVANLGEVSLTVSVPVKRDGVIQGYVWISIPVLLANDMLEWREQPVELIVFNADGDILASEEFSDTRRNVLPGDRSLIDLANSDRLSFRGKNQLGQERQFAVVAIVENAVFALGSWPPESARLTMLSWARLGMYLPVMTWLLSISVAYLGLERLVLRHIKRLRSWMALYALDRSGFETVRLDNAPEELDAVAEAFKVMTMRISSQEAQLQEDIDEKATLLREVHHRVKNNLQLISSIMNMQIRAASSEEAKQLLRGVQERVMALAAIHHRLYMSRNLASVQADKLLEEIVRQLIIVGKSANRAKFTTKFSPVRISPEQSLPLSLLLTEAATNAVKYCGAEPGAQPWISIKLDEPEDSLIQLSIVNSRAPGATDDHEVSGIGSKLIDSFVTQLEGTLEREDLPDRYAIHLTFARASQDPGGEDEV